MRKQFKVFFAVATIANCVLTGPVVLGATAQHAAASAASVPFSCEIRQRAWCIQTGSVEITDRERMRGDDPPGSAWVLRDMNYPTSILVVFEPSGCRNGFADTVEAVSYERNVHWDAKSWEQMTVRLRSDGTCDLKLLLQPYRGDSSEWAFSTGTLLLAACKDEMCTPNGPTPADVTRKYRDEYMSLATRSP